MACFKNGGLSVLPNYILFQAIDGNPYMLLKKYGNQNRRRRVSQPLTELYLHQVKYPRYLPHIHANKPYTLPGNLHG